MFGCRLRGSVRSPFSRAVQRLSAPDRLFANADPSSIGRLIDILMEQVVEGDLTVDEVDGVFVGFEAIGGDHHGLDEDTFFDGITQDLHFVSD